MADPQLAYNEVPPDIDVGQPTQLRRFLSEVANLISRPLCAVRVDSITGSGNTRTITLQVTDRLNRPRPGVHMVGVLWQDAAGALMNVSVTATTGAQFSLLASPAGTFRTDRTGKLVLEVTRLSGATAWDGSVAYLGSMATTQGVSDWS